MADGEKKIFRARGQMTNDTKYASAARIIELEDLLNYRDTWTEPLVEGFNVMSILAEARKPVYEEPKLTMSESGYKIADKAALTEIDTTVRQIKSHLNKLTDHNFETLCEEILGNPHVLEPEVIRQMVTLFFEKSLIEPVFAPLYARLCFQVATHERDCKAAQGSQSDQSRSELRVNIINKAQEVFEAEANTHTEDMNTEELDLFRKRKINNIRFVAELYKNEMISRKIISLILRSKLLTEAPPTETDIEVVCELLTSIGKLLDSNDGAKALHNVYERIQSLIDFKEKPYPNRIKFLMMNLMDLRSKDWAEKKKVDETEITYQAAPDTSKPAVSPAKLPMSASTTSIGRAASMNDLHVDPNAADEQQKIDDEIKKQYSMAVPPSVEESVKRKASSSIMEVADNCKPAEKEMLMLKVVNEEFSSLVSGSPARESRMAAVSFAMRQVMMSSKADERSTIAAVLFSPTLWKDKESEVYRGLAWCLVSCIVDDVAGDCPKCFERFAEALVDSLPTLNNFTTIVKDIFARSANYLNAVGNYEEDMPFEWDEQFVQAWEMFVSTATKRKLAVPKVNEVMDAMSSAKLSSFMVRVVPDVLGCLMEEELCTLEDIAAWAKSREGDSRKKGMVDEVRKDFSV